MNFALTGEQETIRETFRAFAEREIRPHAEDLDRNPRFPREIFLAAGKLGFFGMRYLLALGPDLVGVVALSHNRLQAIAMMRALRRLSSVPIIVGGYHFSRTAEDALRQVEAIDFVCQDEGERTLPELMQALYEKREPATVPGLWVRDDSGRPLHTGLRPQILQLDQLPDPAWHLFDLERYDRPMDGTSMRSFGVMSSRGCPSSCIFCADALTPLRVRSPRRFVDEVQQLHDAHGIRAFDFWDDTLTLKHKHVLGICDELERRNLDIVWYCRARTNGLNPELLERMHRAGCHYISFGVESGSPRILKRIRKKITLDHARSAVRMSLDAGMHVRCNFIASHPDETEDDLLQTLRFMTELEAQNARVQCDYAIMTIFPGTALEGIAREKGLLAPEFSWNAPAHFPKAILAGLPASLPYYEEHIPLERIRALVLRERNHPGQAVRKAIRRLRRIRSREDAVAFARAGIRYFGSLLSP